MTTDAPFGIDAVTAYLKEQGVEHEVVEHRATYTAAEEAVASEVPRDHAAKTIALRDDGEYRFAVLPASERLDVHKAREALDATGRLRLAAEAEMEADFPSFEVGALPPFRPMLPAPETLDERLLAHDRILSAGGDHRHGVLLDPGDLVRIAAPRVADISEN